MITLLVDEAYAFDYLAILEVKKSPLVEKVASHIAKQIGIMKTFNIYSSDEYEDMVKANQLVFDCVERARYGTITAKELDDANMERHKAKIALQQAYFKTNLTETKT